MPRARNAVALISAVCAGLAMLAVPAGASTNSARPSQPAYANPVSKHFADTFADPSLFRGKDGWWYAYGTSDPLREGEGTPHRIPIARSRDLVTWSHVGDAFSAANMPAWAATNASIWAPDIRFVDGQYRMYYVVTETTETPEPNDNAIGMATAPSPAGPWTDSGGPVVGPRRGGVVGDGKFKWTFDPSVVTDSDGSQWLFYGSYYGGIHVTRLSADGRHATGTPTMVAIDNEFEGAYPLHRGGYWYLFASTANCCAGPATGYSVQVGRSRTPKGPYLDRDGVPLTVSRAGGTPVLAQNGNRWVGAGHNAVVTDLGGRDWMAYHAIDRSDPFLDGTDGINQRPMLLDRLDWVDGWPAVRAGTGPSEAPTTAPVTAGRYVTNFTSGIPSAFRGGHGWTLSTDPQSGRFARSLGAGALTAPSPAGDSRVEADLRSGDSAYGLTTRTGSGDRVDVVIDPAAATARLNQTRDGRIVRSAQAPLPAGFAPGQWHSASLQIAVGTAHAQLSHARLGDPFVDLALTLRGPAHHGGNGSKGGQAGAFARAAGAGVDNLSIVKATRPVSRLAKDRVPSLLDRARSDEFDGSTLAGGWTWVRKDDAATLAGGALRWPTQNADLTGTSNSAGVLLREPGPGDWTVETKLGIDLGVDSVRNFQQGGLIAYVNDDLFTRLSHVAIFNTRQTEFGKEMPYAGRLAFGGTIVGPPAATTWLRMTHRLEPRGENELRTEHVLRAWTSRDGRHWVKGGVWTLPAGADVRVGLISHGGAGATSTFDYLRIYRDSVQSVQSTPSTPSALSQTRSPT